MRGNNMSGAEQPRYTLELTDANIEVRQYTDLICAEVHMPGERQEAISQGFKILADYIFGNNISQARMSVSPLVSQQQMSEKIAMTAPVMQQALSDSWSVRFIMPADHTLQTLPKPCHEGVMLKVVPAGRYAVIKFSGLNSTSNLEEHEAQLKAYVHDMKLMTEGEVLYAFYNPPWTPPPLRRNEIMLRLQD